MAYGLAIGDSGEVYELSANAAKRVTPENEINAKKRRNMQQKQRKMAVQKQRKEQQTQYLIVIEKRKAAPKIAAKKKHTKKMRKLFGENKAYLGREDGYRNLPGMIGDGLSGFGEPGEKVISEFGVGADFGSLSKDSGRGNFSKVNMRVSHRPPHKPNRKYLHKAFAGSNIGAPQGRCLGAFWDSWGTKAATNTGTKDANTLNLLTHMNAAIKAKQDFDKLTASNFAKLQKAPASPAKTALIAKVLADGQLYNKETLPKLYNAVNLIGAIPGFSDTAAKFMREIDKPAGKAEPVVVTMATLSGEDTMGVVPIVMGVIGGGAAIAAVAALASYLTANKSATAQMQANAVQIDKLLAVASDTKSSPETKAAALKAIANLTQSTKELSTDTGLMTNLTKLTANMPLLIGIGIAGFLFVRFGLPMLKARRPRVVESVEDYTQAGEAVAKEREKSLSRRD
jgi:hypothetical protein